MFCRHVRSVFRQGSHTDLQSVHTEAAESKNQFFGHKGEAPQFAAITIAIVFNIRIQRIAIPTK
jgi:hypothetical protein